MARVAPPFRLGIGGVSRWAIEAAFAYSDRDSIPLLVMVTESQVGDTGYVANLEQTGEIVDELVARYPAAKVTIGRDHLVARDVGRIGRDEILAHCDRLFSIGFKFIHLDLGEVDCEMRTKLRFAADVVERLRAMAGELIVELSLTPDDDAAHAVDLIDVLGDINEVAPDYLVLPTGSLVLDGAQSGTFDSMLVAPIARKIHAQGVATKEHNADYLSAPQLALRVGSIDAFNIAPELGVLQTTMTLESARRFDLDVRPFLEVAFASRRWERWAGNSRSMNERAILAGHYAFRSSEYEELFAEISSRSPFVSELSAALHKVIRRYL